MDIKMKIFDEEKAFPTGTTYGEIAAQYQDRFADDIILVNDRNNLQELHRTPKEDGELTFITTRDKIGRNAYRRSVVLLMQAAATKVFPGCRMLVQHSLGQGYYCELRKMDFSLIPMDEEMLLKLKGVMQHIVEKNSPIQKNVVSRQEARRYFQQEGRQDKEQLLRYRRNSQMNLYELEGYKDYYYGFMAPSAGYLKAFDLTAYQDGFMLMFPYQDTKKAEVFQPMDKLFRIIDDSAKWGESINVRTVGALNDVIAAGEIQDLILIQEAYMEQRIGDIAERIAREDKKIVLIAGPSSSGKTTFSHRLSIQLMAQGLKPHPIAMDDFYLNRVDTPRDENGEYDFECLEALDISLFNQTMNDLLAGKDVILPVYNFKTGKREFRNKPMKLGEADVLVIEGIHGLNEKLSADLPREKKFKIYISALTQLNIDAHNNLPTTDGRLIRRMVRDYKTRATSARETIARWDSVRKGEEKNIFPFQEEADVMFNSALIYELSVLKLYAEPLLFSIPEDCPEYIEAKRLLKFLDYFLPVPGENIGHNSILREFIGGSCFNV